MPSYKDVEYTLVRSHRRKTASIYVERDGSVTVRVPDNLGDAEIEALIEGKRYWIHKHLTEWRELNAAQVVREYVNGEGFLYLGRSYRLQWIDDQTVPLQLKGGYFLLRRDPTTQMGPEEAFKAFYREQGSKKIPERVARLRTGVRHRATGSAYPGSRASVGLGQRRRGRGQRPAELSLALYDGAAYRAGLHRRARAGPSHCARSQHSFLE